MRLSTCYLPTCRFWCSIFAIRETDFEQLLTHWHKNVHEFDMILNKTKRRAQAAKTEVV